MRQITTRVASIVVGLVVGLAVSPASAQDSDTRYIVQFKPGHKAAGAAAVRAAGARVVLDLDEQEAIAARIPARALAGLQRNPHVDYIEEDAIREPLATGSNITSSGQTIPYGIQMVQADKIQIDPAVAAAKKICIIDSGYYDGHEDLKDVGDGVSHADMTGSGTWNKDSCGHGSHVAGTISAIASNNLGVVGANPGVSLHIVKVFGDDVPDSGSCGWTYASTLVSALNACVAKGANVVSMSLGGSLSSRTEDRAFSDAYSKNNILSIAAAGNGGNNRTSYPAGYSSVISVAAVDANETLASFSQRNKDVELAAPGVAVLSTVPWNQTNSLSAGTSTWNGSWIEGAARTTGTVGTILDGGQCTSVDSWNSAVVLCQRGTNSFAEKVANVKTGGGVAAVIYNNVASDPACDVFSGTLNGTSTIPAIALSCADGSAAQGQVSTTGTVVSSAVFPPTSTGGYEAWDGTSMATPHVSAVAALVWACNPTATNVAVRNALDQTAKDNGTFGRDNSYGFGIVQAKAALMSLGTESCTVLP
jgi:serine protease